uniref:putative receptor-like protein kinase At5g39000 isoform X2 n=1 Tax=Erigeron canadensis TaxID=72917 RepID=UPI001CB8D675|nr:putative receptor-like protein kinase At5g39000 isoform X2 [Erigeron canadensis]
MSFLEDSENLRIPFVDIKEATKNFSTLIGKGGYGLVYKGELLLSGKLTPVAVKRLQVGVSGQGFKEFLTEIQLLTRYKHPNLISLIGFCNEDEEKILIYEYAEHGSLDKYLSTAEYRRTLTWKRRLDICVNAARGLNFLHNEAAANERVIHRDIKSSNVLLDQNWKAMISDLGLSKIGRANEKDTYLITNASGTYGYCDPVYRKSGILTKESDVYSFGVVLFEVLCGRLCFIDVHNEHRFLPQLAKSYYKMGQINKIMDPELHNELDSDSLKKFSEIAFKCIHKTREQRPSMHWVLQNLTHLHDQMQQKIRVSQGQQQFSSSSYNSPTGGKHLEQNYDVPEHDNGERNSLILNGQMSQNIDDVYDNDERVDSKALEDGPGVEDFQVIGDAKPGGRLLCCAYSVNGTSLAMFQWVRYHRDCTMEYIEGATNPEYVVTADDVNKLISVECIPMDDQGRQGQIVRLFANEQNKVTCDPKMEQEIDNYMLAGEASFDVSLLMDSFENWEQITFFLRRQNYQVKINQTQVIIIDEMYTNDLSIKIPSGVSTQFVLTRQNGSSHTFSTINDIRTRDTMVLTMRMFQIKALDKRGNVRGSRSRSPSKDRASQINYIVEL